MNKPKVNNCALNAPTKAKCPWYVGDSEGVLGEWPVQRTQTDQNDQVNFGCGVTELYDGVTGPQGDYYGERTKYDRMMQKQFGCSREKYSFQDQKKTLEQRSRNDLGMVSEGYCGGQKACDCATGCNCPFARTSDNPFNPWNKYARNVVLR